MDNYDRERHKIMHKMRKLKQDGKEIPTNMEEKVIDFLRKYNLAEDQYKEM